MADADVNMSIQAKVIRHKEEIKRDKGLYFETGVDHGVLYVQKADGTYDDGVSWNGACCSKPIGKVIASNVSDSVGRKLAEGLEFHFHKPERVIGRIEDIRYDPDGINFKCLCVPSGAPRHSGRYPWGEKRRAKLSASPGYLFANREDIRRNMVGDWDLESDVYTWAYANGNVSVCVKLSRFGVESYMEQDGPDDGERKLKDDVVDALCEKYDKAIIREVFNMNPTMFNTIVDNIRACGGQIAVAYSYDSMNRPNNCFTIEISEAGLEKLFAALKTEREMPELLTKTPHIDRPWHAAIPPIEDVRFYNDRATEVTFADGTKTKCVCDKEDTFSESVGIAYCLFKRALGKNGHKWFNQLMRDARKAMAEKAETKALLEKMIAEEKQREEKRIEKARKRRMKKLQEKVNVIKEALKQDRKEQIMTAAPAWVTSENGKEREQ